MGDKNEAESWVGVIPDFFHDILAYLIPGYVALILCLVDWRLAQGESLLTKDEFGFFGLFAAFVSAYVIGKAFEQVGYRLIHTREWPYTKKARKRMPKWRLLFEEPFYTNAFKKELQKAIGEWYKTYGGPAVVEECKGSEKDEYFNLIQFYLRERFPAVALYEKKQNAAIVLSRSLSLIFLVNIVFYHVFLLVAIFGVWHTHFDPAVLTWLVVNGLFSWIFYFRFIQDNRYHAMYIFETFIATKKLLKDL
ncbi:MAG TPA: hypothetical protein VGT99_08545 [Gammaproteobacteria bacterium]|nr:hypothetical protein [Gammaproteobacteria bacterium]